MQGRKKLHTLILIIISFIIVKKQSNDKEINSYVNCCLGFPDGAVVKNPHANAEHVRDTGLIPGSGRFPWGRNGNPLQCSCLENSLNRGAWQVTVQGVTRQTWPRDWAHKQLSIQMIKHYRIIKKYLKGEYNNVEKCLWYNSKEKNQAHCIFIRSLCFCI